MPRKIEYDRLKKIKDEQITYEAIYKWCEERGRSVTQNEVSNAIARAELWEGYALITRYNGGSSYRVLMEVKI